MRTAARFASERFIVIDRALRAREYPNAVTIAARLEVGRRTVQRDFAYLRERLGAPIAFDHARNGYFYTDPTYHLPAIGLTEGELVAVCLAGQSLRHFEGGPLARPLGRALKKILAGMGERVTVDSAELAHGLTFRATAPADVAPDILEGLIAAVRGRRRLRIRYWSASRGMESTRVIDPYHLTFINGYAYLIAFCGERGAVRIFAPSRVRALESTVETFAEPVGFDLSTYLADCFAVFRGDEGERHRVRLRLAGVAACYVAERTWHPSQAIESASGEELVVTFDLGHLREIERFALGWGADCEVLDPPELRERVRAALEAAAAHYRVPS